MHHLPTNTYGEHKLYPVQGLSEEGWCDMKKKVPRVVKKGDGSGQLAKIKLKGEGKLLDADGLKMKRRVKEIKIPEWKVGK